MDIQDTTRGRDYIYSHIRPIARHTYLIEYAYPTLPYPTPFFNIKSYSSPALLLTIVSVLRLFLIVEHVHLLLVVGVLLYVSILYHVVGTQGSIRLYAIVDLVFYHGM